MVVWVAVVRVAISRILSTVRLRLRARSTSRGLLLLGLLLTLLLLARLRALRRRIGSAVATVLAVVGSCSESGLAVHGAALGVLAEVVALSRAVTPRATLLRGQGVVLASLLLLLLAKLLSVVVVGVSFMLARSVIGRIIGRSRGECPGWLLGLCLRGLRREVVEWWLRCCGLLAERVETLLAGPDVLRCYLAEPSVLLSEGGRGVGG